MECARCGFANPTGFRYCGQCGSPLQLVCDHCHHTNRQQARFCNQCGSPLGTACPQCGSLEVPNAHFCGNCGFRLEKICSECQTINPLHANYCNHCANELPQLEVEQLPSSTQTAPILIHPPRPPKASDIQRPTESAVIPQPTERKAPPQSQPEPVSRQDDERLNRLQEYIPEALRSMILNTKGKIEGERKPVTIVFADVSGYTALSERFTEEPEEIARIIDECHRLMSDCIYKYEGIIDKIVGDEVMALFGAPLSHENDAERAILTSLEMIEQIVAYGKKYDLPLNLHIGINTGTVVVGDIGTAGRLMNYTVIGDPVNLAARLEKVAEAGEIAVGENTYRLTSRLFQWPDEPLHVELKGKTGPQAVHKVLGRKEHREDMRGLDGLQSQMIGRDKEFQSLQQSIAKVESGQGQIGVIMGEAGLGKSRLKREFRNSLEGRAIWVEGQCLSHTPQDANAYSVFIDAIGSYFQILGSDTEDIARDKIQAGVAELFCESDISIEEEVLPFLFRIMSLPLNEQMAQAIQYLEQDPENFRHRTFFAVHDLVEKIAEKQPLVLALEDLHWVDELSIELILFLMRTLLDARVLLLCVYRPERTDACWRIGETAKSTFAEFYTEVAIGRLEDTYMSEVFHSLLRLADTEENHALERLVLEKVQGNPFYMEEMIRSLLDNGVLKRGEQSDIYELTQPVEDIEVPPGVEAIIRTRIDRLDNMQIGAKRTLQHASVVGRIFEQKILAGILDSAEELPDHFGTLMQLELIAPVPAAPEPQFQFQHLLTYQISYDSLILRRRRGLHTRVAAVLETEYPIERYPGRLSEITYHYRRSDHHVKAIAYLLRSGQLEQSMVNYARAHDCYREAAERLALKPEGISDVERRESYASCCEGLGDTCAVMGKYRKSAPQNGEPSGSDDGKDDCGAEDAYLAALEYLPNAEDKARIYNSLGHVYERLAEWDKAVQQYQMGLDILGDLDSPEKPRLHNGLGWLHYRRGRYSEATQEYNKALEMLRDSTDYVTLSELYKNLAVIAFQSGKAEESFESMEHSIEVARATNNELLLAKLYNTRAEMWRTSKSVDEAISSIQQGLAIREKYGELDGIAHSKMSLANAYRQKNELDLAVKCYEDAEVVAKKVGNIRLLGDIYNGLGLVSHQRDDISAAIGYYEKALTIQEELQRPRGVAICHLNIGDIYRLQGDFAKAEIYLNKAIQQAEAIGNQQIPAYAYHTLAEMALDQQHWDQALMQCEKSAALAKKLGDNRLLGDCKQEMGRVFIGLNRLEESQACLNEARKLYAELGDIAKLDEVDQIIQEVAAIHS